MTRNSASRDGDRASGRWRIEWPTIGLLASCHAVWLLGGSWLWTVSSVLSFLVVTFAIALHSSLMHEASHGHPTRSGLVNEILVGLPLGLVYPFRRFRALHLRHHADERLTDPFDDPESHYRALWQHERLPRWVRRLLLANNMMAGRLAIGPALSTFVFLAGEARLLRAGDRAVQRAWRHHAMGLAVLAPIVLYAFAMPVWAYLLAVYLGQSLIAIRTFAEHRWSERPDGRTLIVEHSPLALLFLNNNLHLVHHKLPNAPWYDLPRLFRSGRAEWVRMNGGYVYANYFVLFRDWAFRAKEPVVHPALRRVPEPGRALRPRQRAKNVHGLGTVPVPAEPARE